MALTERLDILINASGSKAVREFSLVGKAASTEMGKASKAGDVLTGSLANAGAMAKAGLAAGLTVGAGALLTFAKTAVNAASDLGEQMSATNVIFKSGASIVQDYAKTTSTAIGVSRRAALEASNSFGDLFLNVGFTQKQSGTLSVALVQLAGDLASFKNLGTDVVLDKLRSGIVGETEPLRALGIVINEAAVKSKAMEMGLGGANRELTDGEKIAARYALIIEKTKNAQGDAARTSESLANKTRQLAAQTEDAEAMIGEKLTPTVGLFATKASNALTIVDKFAGKGAGSGAGIAGLVDSVIDATPGFGPLNMAIDFFSDKSTDAGKTADLLAQAERDLGLAAGSLATKTKDLGKAQQLAAAAAEEHAKQIDKQNQAMISALDAELGYERSLNSLEDAEASVTEAQKALTDAVAAHGAKSPEAAAATEALSRAQLGLRGEVLQAAQAFATKAQQQAIATGKEWDAVAAARAQITGLQDMKNKYPELHAQIDEYIAKLKMIPGVIDTNVILRTPYAAPNSQRQRSLTADGGIFRGAQWRVIGEDGPEAVIPLSSSRSGRAAQLMGQAGLGGGGGSGNNITIIMPPGSDGDDVVNKIKQYERRNGTGWRSAS